MSMLYVLAKDISPQSYKKAIRLRLIRTYIVTEGRNKSAVKSQECVFHDIEGTYVHATIHADFIDQFSHLLKEGKVYAVKNFVTVSYYYQYKTTQHKYMMRFNQYTTIERHRRKGFPSLLFRIKPIEELLAGKVEEKLLNDVIGRVVEFYSPKDKVIGGFPTQLVDFLIEDSKGNRIKCTLWDEHVPAVMPFFNNHSDGHLIVLLQLCRAKTVDNEVRISSSYTATKVLFNLDCQEFAYFRNSLKANCSPLRSISVVSYGHSANNSQSPMVVSTIRDLYERAEEGYYYVPGTIVSIESGKKWFYNSCRKPGCYKSLTLTETYYFCDTCKTNWAEGNVRYKVIVRVLDKTSDAPFVLWDKDCFELLGITAYDLKIKYSMSKMQVPVEFEQLRNKSMVFRINLKNEHIRNPAKPISVLSVSRNEELEAQYCPSMLDDQDELSRMIEEDADDLESEESESGDEAISPIVQANLKLKGVANDQDEVDTGAIKRCLLDQFSSSQNLKKC
nr:replication protein A 70 kDa DNA-binding subunit B-like [Ipomoea batatas]